MGNALGAPYADLGLTRMAGNYGPRSKMRTAMAACTPNVPWAKFGCASVVRFDGSGTSAATPQVAAESRSRPSRRIRRGHRRGSGEGFVEGLNNKIRVIQRRAYGLRNEEYLRLKILTCMLPAL
jgi:hypothetical protein